MPRTSDVFHAVRRHLASGLLSSLASLPAAQAWTAEPDQWLLHAGGLSRHFEQTRAPGRHWREQHPGLGLERRQTGQDGWHWRQSAGLVQDSRDLWGGYAGVALMREWRTPGATSLGLGLGAHAFYRSVSWSGRRAWVPALLPMASFGALDDGLGVNVLLVPPIGASGERRPALLYLQWTYRLR